MPHEHETWYFRLNRRRKSSDASLVIHQGIYLSHMVIGPREKSGLQFNSLKRAKSFENCTSLFSDRSRGIFYQRTSKSFGFQNCCAVFKQFDFCSFAPLYCPVGFLIISKRTKVKKMPAMLMNRHLTWVTHQKHPKLQTTLLKFPIPQLLWWRWKIALKAVRIRWHQQKFEELSNKAKKNISQIPSPTWCF